MYNWIIVQYYGNANVRMINLKQVGEWDMTSSIIVNRDSDKMTARNYDPFMQYMPKMNGNEHSNT